VEPRRRRLLLAGGIASLAAAWAGPVPDLARHTLLSMHLVQLTLLMGVAPPLVLLGLGVSASRSRWQPWAAVAALNAGFLAWHLVPAHQGAMASVPVYIAEQLSLLAVSLWFWRPVVASAANGGMAPMTKLGYLLLAAIPQTFGGLLLALSHRLLYPAYGNAAASVGLSPLDDQHLAGVFMALLTKVALFAAFSVVLWRVLSANPGEDDDDRDDEADPGATPPPGGLPAWLEQLERPVQEPQPRGRSLQPVEQR
jgi:cytochrome c oxidase assembly factor CtaG